MRPGGRPGRRPGRRPGEPDSAEGTAGPGQVRSRQPTRQSLAPASGAQSALLNRVSPHGRSRAQGPSGTSALVPRSRAAGPALSRFYHCIQIQGPLSLSLSLFSASRLSSRNVFCVIVPEALPQSPDVLIAPAEKSCHASCLSPAACFVFPRTRVRKDPQAPCGCGL